jgi:hypothetical protein
MLRRHFLPVGILIGLGLILFATTLYPGGSAFNAASVGFSWKENYLCNLFGATAVNGALNSARFWAIGGWCVMCVTAALFFVTFSQRIPEIGPSRIICYCGVIGMLSSFLAVTPLHNFAITALLVFTMIAVLYILVFVFKSRLTWLKVLGCLTMLMTYAAAYVYYTSSFLEALPTLQKASVGCILVWFLCLHYLTTKADFRKATPS